MNIKVCDIQNIIIMMFKSLIALRINFYFGFHKFSIDYLFSMPFVYFQRARKTLTEFLYNFYFISNLVFYYS